MQRVVRLTRHLDIPITVCINKWDLKPDMTATIASWGREQSISVTGRIRYDRTFTAAQLGIKTVVEYARDGVAEDIRGLWEVIRPRLGC
ncbi:MAG TPA: hypothetical protein PL151_08920 [Phycisphaerae bacterium]|nr:hypothetical protein [Phycisphaerae bacterium]HQE27869.1 hypothetical protein [Phycisphaerae bacterium]